MLKVARFGDLSFLELPMDRKSCGTSKVSWSKNDALTRSSRGALIRAIKSSRYSVMPRNVRKVRDERTAHVTGSSRWYVRSGGGVGEENLIMSHVSLGNAERPVASASGDMYPIMGISAR